MKKIYIFALAAHGQGISGSDRIFMEFARRWSKSCSVTIYVWEEGYQMCQREGLNISSIKYQVSSMLPWRKFGFIVNYFARIIEGIRIGLILKVDNPQKTIVYSASDFWMDCLPAFILKIRFSSIRWVAGWYQTAPKPLWGFSENVRSHRYRLNALIYWLSQLPMRPIIAKFADFVMVNNQEERRIFAKLDERKRVIVVLGAVDLTQINIWKRKLGNLPKIYDGVFQGRFHPQKGILELIDIWRLVVNRKPDAKLVMIGDGPLMQSAKLKIKNEKLENNIRLAGYLFDGEEKYKIFSQSKIVVHPALYDSGGMAAAEAMAFRLPAVGFDLKSFKSYYPHGMIKVEIGNLSLFARSVLELLNDESQRAKIGRDALNMININWSWAKRAQEVLSKLI